MLCDYGLIGFFNPIVDRPKPYPQTGNNGRDNHTLIVWCFGCGKAS